MAASEHEGLVEWLQYFQCHDCMAGAGYKIEWASNFQIAIRTTPPTTNIPPDMTPRDGSKEMRDRMAVTHRNIPKRIKIVPRIWRTRAVLCNQAAVRRRLNTSQAFISQPTGVRGRVVAEQSGIFSADATIQRTKRMTAAAIAKPAQIMMLARYILFGPCRSAKSSPAIVQSSS